MNNSYNINYSTFKTELDKSIINKQNKINDLVGKLGFNIVDSNIPTTTQTTTQTSTTSSTPIPTIKDSFTNITDRLSNSEKKIDKEIFC